MIRNRQRLLAFTLATLLWGSLGLTCEDFVSNPNDADVPVQLRLEVVDTYAYISSMYVVVVDIVVIADAPVQAVDMGILWHGSAVTLAAAIPHADFDDDGKLFSSGVQGTDSLSGIVDLKHGAPATRPLFRVSRVALLVKNSSAPLVLRATGEIAGPDGSLYDIVVSESAKIAPPAL